MVAANHDDGPDEFPQLSRAGLRSARRLQQRKIRAETGLFLVEGTQAIREALAHGRSLAGGQTVERLIVDDPGRHAELLDMAIDERIDVVQATSEQIDALSETVTSQGIFAVCRWPETDLDSIEAPRLVVICAQVRDPGNAGTVIRCADAFGADAVLMSHGSVDATNSKTVRASVGSVFHLPVVTGLDLPQVIEWAHGVGLQVVAADAGGQPLDVVAASGGLSRPTAWLTGNEAWGLPAPVLALADQVVAIPMWGRAESLNLSTAAAVCLYATASAQHRQ
ncbi:TrmH family RNA methyltransferase [Propionibacterium sp.]|uniref:TrmH family RNA methyltransferase n=1 Tax=Propionibacterium sp. TaxID=1977903 RepID=UPI0039ED7350